MSTQLYYSLSYPNQRAANTMSYSDNASFLSGPNRRSPPHQGFGPGGINMYNQQQIQSALYQQQQIEFAQQQAQLEMHLQLEQMRLQNLALQEQIMIGQVQAHQAHAQSQAEQQLHNAYYSASKAPHSARVTFTQGQGGMLAERALARRQQAEADALYAQCYPNVAEEDDVLRELAHGHQFSAVPDRPNNLTPPAVVVSKPDEAFPLLVSADPPFAKGPSHAKQINDSAFESRSNVSSDHKSAGSQSQVSPPSNLSDKSPGRSSPAPSIKKKFSDVVKSSARASSPFNSSAALAAKLNPFSLVFVPGSAPASDQEAVALVPPPHASPPEKGISFTEESETNAAPGVYRPPRSKSPPSAKAIVTAAPCTPTMQPVAGALPTRQPRGPAAEAELTNQNFASRIRKRAIKALATRPSNCSSPVSAVSPTNYQYYHQQQMLEALMMQQQQHALAAAGYLESDLGFHPAMVSPGGIAHLMATARAREERFGY